MRPEPGHLVGTLLLALCGLAALLWFARLTLRLERLPRSRSIGVELGRASAMAIAPVGALALVLAGRVELDRVDLPVGTLVSPGTALLVSVSIGLWCVCVVNRLIRPIPDET